MPRFFFHIHDNVTYRDDEGYIFEDAEAARDQAIKAARDIMADDLKSGRPLALQDRIEVTDEGGTLVLLVTFREAAGLDS